MNDLNLPTLDIEDIDIDEIEQSKMDLVEDESGGAIRYGIVGSGQGGGRMAKAFFDLGYRKTIAFNLAQSAPAIAAKAIGKSKLIPLKLMIVYAFNTALNFALSSG